MSSEEQYEKLWKRSIDDPEGFWGDIAREFDWIKPFDTVKAEGAHFADTTWFGGGKLNVAANCIDRHVNAGRGDKPAITWEEDDGSVQTFTYNDVLAHVSRWGNALREQGVGKGDRVTILLPMIPDLAFAVLACARIGAIHSVVFAGFSSAAIANRIEDCQSTTVITADAGVRGGRPVPLKSHVDEAVGMLSDPSLVQRVLVVHRKGDGVGTGAPGWVEGRDIDAGPLVAAQPETCEPEAMDAEDPLFILYTSGSTGKPKGVLHTQAGYMVYAATTFRYVFDNNPDDDVHFCTADIGWITGHSYILYGPLANGAHTVMFEGVPTYPDAGRLWEICDKHRVTTFYTAPTALRALMVHGDEPVKTHSRDSVRLLGTVGEPINPAAWEWYYDAVGERTRPIVDTWWQTETGGILITPLPGAHGAKPGSAAKPFFGVLPAVVHPDGTDCAPGEQGALVMRAHWPGLMRTVYGDHKRFKDTYFSQMEGVYYTGDGAVIDKDGYVWITGRLDDVVNVSGHRLGTAEVESALVAHPAVCEAAVVGFPHSIKGEGIYCYVTLEAAQQEMAGDALAAELRKLVRKTIGAIATPDAIHFTHVLPKTRSGKIMRRILRKVAANDTGDLGDTSTLADPSVVESLIAGRCDV